MSSKGPVTVKSVRPKAVGNRHDEPGCASALLVKKDEFPNRLSGGQKQRVHRTPPLAMGAESHCFPMNPPRASTLELIGEVLNVMTAQEGTTMLVGDHEMGLRVKSRPRGSDGAKVNH